MRRVADAMLEPPVVVDPSTTVQETSARMLDAGVHAAVVAEKGTVCGLITADEVSSALLEGHDPSETPIGAIADRTPALLEPDEALADAHQRMRAEGRPVAAVVDAKRHPLGVLADSEAAVS